jgi:chromosome partitioning protein
MFTAALVSQSGGVGKTTLSCALALCAHLDGLNVGVVDADQEGSGAFGWYQRRVRVTGKTVPPFALVATPARLREAVKAARDDGMDWLFIDTAAGTGELPALAAELADIVLIPCIGSANKIAATAPTVRLVKKLRRRAFFIVNGGSSSKAINDACALALTSKYGLPAAATHITDRKPIRYAEDRGEALPELANPDATTARGADEFRALWRWLRAQMETAPGETTHDEQEEDRRLAVR